MITLAITGGIGMGKSTAASLLRHRGFPVIDSDEVAREIVEPGQPALAEISGLFGSGILDGEGRLRRDELARRVFSDETARRQLEAILHPRIRDRWAAQLEAWRGEGRTVGVAVIPLLFETGAASSFDSVLCVACSAPTQLRRLKERGWSDEDIARRNAAQWRIEKKMRLSNFVIWNEAGLEQLATQLERVAISIGASKST